jgi:2'-5' RNA ligase
VRVFVALPLPEGIRAELDPWLDRCRQMYPDLRWVSTGQIHLTLRFLGDVGERQVEEAADVVRSYDGGPIGFTLDRSGTFPGRGPGRLPSVYWIAGEWDPAVRDLAASLAAVRDDRGNRGRMNRFHPHLTIARQGRYNEKAGIPDPGPWTGTMDRAVVYSSLLTPAGPEYSELHGFDLTR